MKSTGIVRKIDSLGRIVIPKEIRNNMHIKVGDSLELHINNNNDIILRKFSNIGNVSLLADNIVCSINSIINENVFITDMEKIVSVSGNLKKMINCSVSSSYIKLITKRKPIMNSDMTSLLLTNESLLCSYALVPIIVNGELLGSIIVLSEKRSIKDLEFDVIKVISSFFTKYLEE